MAQTRLGRSVRRRRKLRRRPSAIATVAAILIGVLTTPSVIACGPQTPPQRSIESVIFVLSDCYLDRSVQQDREYIAPILQTAEGFIGVVTVGEPGHDRFRLRITTSAAERLVALWHTHGKPGYARELFSTADTQLANRLGLPSYLTTPDGETRVYLPGAPTPIVRDAFRRVLPRGVAAGKLVAFDTGTTGVHSVAMHWMKNRDLERTKFALGELRSPEIAPTDAIDPTEEITPTDEIAPAVAAAVAFTAR
jgi:hypothetical protein